jgi:hypothetical protein
MIRAQRGAVVEHRVEKHLRTQWDSRITAALRDGG